MSVAEDLMKRVMDIQQQRGNNPQSVLDQDFFQKLSLEEKVRLIKAHRAALATKPKYETGRVIGSGLVTGAMTAGVVGAHSFMNTTAKGLPFKINPWGLATAAGAGFLVDTIVENLKARNNYSRDVTTQENAEDPVSVLAHRVTSGYVPKKSLMGILEQKVSEFPKTFGGLINTIDFDSLDKKVSESPKTSGGLINTIDFDSLDK